MFDELPKGTINFARHLPVNFQAEIYEKTHLYMPAAFSKAEIEALFTVRDFDALFANGLINQDQVSVITEGRASRRSVAQTYDEKLDGAGIREQIAAGNTLVVNTVEKSSPAVHRLVRSIERSFGHIAQVNSYTTPAGKTGFPAHVDGHGVFILQIAGKKIWKVYREYENRIEHPSDTLSIKDFNRFQFKPIEDSVEEYELSVGDMLYLPCGAMHAAFCTDEPSCHLTISVHPISWGDYLRAAIKILEVGDATFRAPSPLKMYSEKQDLADANEALGEILSKIAAIPAEQIEHYLYRRRVSRKGVAIADTVSGHLWPTSRLVKSEPDQQADEWTILKLADRATFRIFEDAGGNWRLWTMDHEVELGAKAAPLLKHLRDCGSITRRELEDALGVASAADLANMVVQLGLAS